ncbi:MAG: LamG domain-containing protein [Spirulina sp.]
MTDTKPEFKQEPATHGEMPRDNMGGDAMGHGMNPIEGERPIPDMLMETRSIVKSGDITLRHQDGNLSVDWKTAPDGYQVAICKANYEVTSVKSENPPTTFPTQSLPAGEYWVKVKVSEKKQVEEREISQHVEGEPSIVKLETPTNISLSYADDNQTLKVTWDKVDGATSYKVEIVQIIDQAESDRENQIDFALSSLSTPATMAYQAWVQAKGNEQYIDSNIGKSLTVSLPSLLPPEEESSPKEEVTAKEEEVPKEEEATAKEEELPPKEDSTSKFKLSTPRNITQSYNDKTKKLTSTWNRVNSGSGYLVQVVNIDDNNKVVTEEEINDSQLKTIEFDPTQFITIAGNYQIWIKALGNDNYWDSDFGQASTTNYIAWPEEKPETQISGLQLNGSTDYLEVPSYKGVTGKNSRTVEAWIKTTETDRAIVSWGKNENGKKWTFRVQSTDGKPNTIRAEINGGYIVGSTPVSDGKWHHVACTVETQESLNVTDVKLYVDGKLEQISAEKSQALNTATGGRNIFIGNDFSDRYFDGAIDEVRIWNTPRTARQIKAKMNQRLTGKESGLAAYWRFEAENAKDYSGNDRHGTYKGNPPLVDPAPLTDSSSLPPEEETKTQIFGLELLEKDKSYVEIQSYKGVTGKNSRTVEAWIKTTETDRAIVSWGKKENGKKWTFRVQSNDGKPNTIRLEIGNGYIIGSTAVNDGKWHHVACTLEAKGSLNVTDAKLYVDGKLETISAKKSQALNTATGGKNVLIGNDLSDRYFDGVIDEVRIWNTPRTARQIQTNMNQRLTGKESSLVAYWRFEAEGATDYSGNDRNGTYQGKPQFVDPAPLTDSPALPPEEETETQIFGLQFKGSTGSKDYIEIPSYKGVTEKNSRTVEAWIKTTQTDRAIVSWGKKENGKKWTFRVQSTEGNPNTIRVEIGNGYIIGSTPVTDGKWHHVACTLETQDSLNVTDVKLYVDGKLEKISAKKSQALNTATGGKNVLIGNDFGDRYFDGVMDEVRIWNTPRTEREIKAKMNQRLTGKESGLAAYWRFEAESAKDYSGNDRNGTYQGNPQLVDPAPLT